MNEADKTPPALSSPKNRPSVWFWLSAISVIGSCLITFILLVFVVPVFAEMFADFGAELPKPTQIIIGLSSFMKSYFLFIQFPVTALLALAIWGLYELDKRGQKAIIILFGIIMPVVPLILTLAMFLPIFQLSSMVD